MLNKTLLSGKRFGRLWVAGFLVFTLIIFVMSLAVNQALAFSVEPKIEVKASSLYLQIEGPITSTLEVETTSTDDDTSLELENSNSLTESVRIQTTSTDALTDTFQLGATSVYSFSLTALGYEERTLNSPGGATQYSFRVPENWVIQDSILELDLSYIYSQVQGDTYPVFLGDLTIRLNGKTLTIFSIDEIEINHRKLRVPLPASLLMEDPDQPQTIEAILSADFLCEVPHKASLVIHPNSFVLLDYDQRPLESNLSRYPRPFYQQSFDPDSVRFVFADQPSQADASGAVAMAAKLGDLTGQRLVISATTDIELESLVSNASSIFDEHLIIIGQPQTNQILPLLNNIIDLPVSLHERQLELITLGPTTVAPGDEFTYEFDVTNITSQDSDLTLVNSLPFFTDLVECTGNCAVDSRNNTVIWDDILLEPGESIDISLTLQATDTLNDSVLENTITLIDADLGPVNADTLVSTIVSDSSDSVTQESAADQTDYFFVYKGQAVAKEDGIIQEFISPWSEDHAILIITGLSEEAIRKASQAMSSETRFPGMQGQVALVRDALSPAEIENGTEAAVEMTFEDLGYEDRVVRGKGQQVDYIFEVPYSWQLTEDAMVDLYFSHSQLVDFDASGVTAIINREPIASAELNAESAGEGHLQFSLADADIIERNLNQRLRLEIDMAFANECNANTDKAWFLIKNKSKIALAHQEEVRSTINLADYPYPFQSRQTLSSLLFALPEAPTANEWESALTLAANLGSAASAETLTPTALLATNTLPPEDLSNYYIIAIGRPSRNAFIQKINDMLPQPFLPGTDVIEQRLDDVILRLPTDFDLGYTQLLSSPWNKEAALLVVTGTTDNGVDWATDALAYTPWMLGGNLSLIKDEQIDTVDTRELTTGGVAVVVATAVPDLAQIETSEITTNTLASITPTPEASSSAVTSTTPTSTPIQVEPIVSTPTRPTWMNFLIMSTAVIVVGIFAFAFWQSRRRTIQGKM